MSDFRAGNLPKIHIHRRHHQTEGAGAGAADKTAQAKPTEQTRAQSRVARAYQTDMMEVAKPPPPAPKQLQATSSAADTGQKLAAQMQRLTPDDVYGVNGSMQEKIKAGSKEMAALQHDADIIKYAEHLDPKGVAANKAEFYANHSKDAPFELSRQLTSMALTYATQGSSDDPKEQALIDAAAKKAEGVNDNPYLRQNCYAFAVEGVNLGSANPIGLGAVPGNVTMGRDALDGKTDAATIIDRVRRDGAIPAGTDPSKLNIPKGMRLVAMYEDPGHDYHFNRIDQSADGKKIAMTGKDGLQGKATEILQREYAMGDAFNASNGKNNVMNYSQKYQFKQFFYVPQQGLNVGMDAHLISKGKLEPQQSGETTQDYAMRVDVAYHEEIQRH